MQTEVTVEMAQTIKTNTESYPSLSGQGMARNISDMMPIFRDKSMDKSLESHTTNVAMNEGNKLLSKFDSLQSKSNFIKQPSMEMAQSKPME